MDIGGTQVVVGGGCALYKVLSYFHCFLSLVLTLFANKMGVDSRWLVVWCLDNKINGRSHSDNPIGLV